MPAKVIQAKTPAKLRLMLARDCDDIAEKAKLSTLNKSYKFHFVHSNQLDELWKQTLMDLFELNMKSMYEKSKWGYDYEDKLSELTKSTTRLVLVTTTSHDSENISNKLPDELDDSREFVAFLSYRFETGADKSECALYVYEVQVVEKFQGLGVGKELMRFAKTLATAFKMDKIMLTVFQYNTQGLNFYKKLRFSPDKSTPSKQEADYVILSHKIK